MKASARPTFREALRFWVKLGFINFGGPAGQIAVMHRELVDERKWVGEGQFLRALNFCMLLPGPEAQQLAIYIGWRLHGILGGIVAGTWFVIPSIFVLLVLSYLAVAHTDVPAIRGLLYGVQAVVIAIVVDAVIRVGRRTVKHPALIGIAVVAFVAIYFLRIGFPWVVGGAALAGLLLHRWFPEVFRTEGHGGGGGQQTEATETDAAAPEVREQDASPTLLRAAKVIGTFLLLWLVPMGLLTAWRGFDDVLTQEAWFFTKAAFVTFGGAYAVLAYVADAVNVYGWVTPEEVVLGLGLAESTPGPLIMVTSYVGFVAAWKLATGLHPVVAGVLGSLITVYATFLPPFLFVFLGAPYIEKLQHNRRLGAALAGVTAAVVGVIANLAVFFGLSVLFPKGRAGGADWFALVVAVVAFAAIKRLKLPIYYLVPIGALAGMLWVLAGLGSPPAAAGAPVDSI